MTPAELASFVRDQTNTDATTFSDAQILTKANVFIDDIAKEIAKTHRGFFGRVFTYNLVADQRNYPLETDLLNGIRSVEAQLDGTNWKWLTSLDITALGKPTDETDIRAAFAGKDPRYDIFQKEIWIYSESAIVNVTGGLKVRCDVYPEHLTSLSGSSDLSINSSSTKRGFPRAVHELLARRIIIAFKESKDKPIPLTQTEQKYEFDLVKAISALRDSNQDEVILAPLPFNDGNQF